MIDEWYTFVASQQIYHGGGTTTKGSVQVICVPVTVYASFYFDMAVGDSLLYNRSFNAKRHYAPVCEHQNGNAS